MTTPTRNGLSVPPGNVPAMTIRERMALDLAGRHYRYGGAREADVRDLLGMSLAQHAQLVGVLVDRPDVEAEAPQLVHRLRRLREQRAAARRTAA